jgi:hypothetical protein
MLTRREAVVLLLRKQHPRARLHAYEPKHFGSTRKLQKMNSCLLFQAFNNEIVNIWANHWIKWSWPQTFTFHPLFESIECSYSKKIRTNPWKCPPGASFAPFLPLESKCDHSSEPLSQISSNFQDSILIISQLNPLTKKKLGQTSGNVRS